MPTYIIELTVEERETFIESLALLLNDSQAQSSENARACKRLLALLDIAKRKD